MRQILQSLSNGQTELVEVPCPNVGWGQLRIHSRVSLVSAGTERMLVEFGKASLFEKARQQPEKIRQVLDKIQTDGLLPTLAAVKSKLDRPIPLGYCNVGTVLDVGPGVEGFDVGDRVASNGAHAEIVCVPKNLCAKIPDRVSDDAAAFTVLGSIGLQGVRLASPTLGEAFVVSGLGLIGLVTVQLLRAHGCRVLGLDYSPERLRLAEEMGAETFNLSAGDPLAAATQFSRGRGVDGVLITAATDSDEPVHQAAQMCRRRGRIVLVGVVGLKLSRADFYEKELTFQVSCSYGPGRYDPDYENGGADYPVGFVRWTEQRNFEAMLDLMASGQINPACLISHRFSIEDAVSAYGLISSKQPSLGVLLEYPQAVESAKRELRRQTIRLHNPSETKAASSSRVAIIGAGNYASQVLIPALKKCGANLYCVASQNGLTAAQAARKFGFEHATSDLTAVMSDSSIDTVVIATRHDSHAHFVCQALEAGKHVFVEKPLALNVDELHQVAMTYSRVSQTGARRRPLLNVGFNRRFAPQIQQAKALLAELNEPKSIVITVNAGAIPTDHWAHDPQVGGGRVIGEGCHFIDLMRFLCDAPISSVHAAKLGPHSAVEVSDDKISITLTFADGSCGTVHYLANGHRSISKERIDIYCAGRVIQIDNFRRMNAAGWKTFRKMNLWQQDKGHVNQVRAFLRAIAVDGAPLIAMDELVEVTTASFDAVRAAQSKETIHYTASTLQESRRPMARSA